MGAPPILSSVAGPRTRRSLTLRVGAFATVLTLVAAVPGTAQSVYLRSSGAGAAPRVLDGDYYRRPYPELIRPRPGLLSLATVNEQEPNNSVMTAPLIALGDTVVGFVDQPGDEDYFAIDVPADTRLDLDVDAFTIGSDLDGRIDLYDVDGQTLLDLSQDVIGLDPRLVFEVQTAGRYYVRLTDEQGGGGGTFGYQLKMGIVEKGPGDPTMLWTTGLGGPLGVAAGPGGEFYVVDNTNVRVLHVDGASGVSTPLASLVSSGLGPNVDVVRDVAVDAFGNILAVGVRDVFQPLVWRIAPDGTVTDFWVPVNTAARFSAITVAPDGDVWLGDEGLRNMVRLAPYGAPDRDVLEFVPIDPAAGDIFDIALSPGGRLHWSNGFGEIYRLDPGGTVVQVAQASSFLEGLAFDRDGYLYAANGGIGKVLLFAPDGTVVDDPFAGTNLAGPLNLVFGRTPDGATSSRLFAVNFGIGLPPPFAGGMVEMNPAAIRAPGWPVADFLGVTAVVPAAEYGLDYQVDLGLTSGGTAAWTVVDGVLPIGLELDPGTGTISGRPEQLGDLDVTVQAAVGGRVGLKTLHLRVSPPNVTSDAVAAELMGGPATVSPERRAALDLLGNRNGGLDIGDLRALMRAYQELPGQIPPVRSAGGVP